MFETTIIAPTPRRSRKESERAKSYPLPPPIGGWNSRDALPNMPETDALVLDNWIPGTNGVAIRGGYTLWVDGLAGAGPVATPEDPMKGDPVETLMPYSPPSGAPKFFAATHDHIWNITAGTAVSSLGGQTNGRWSFTNFASAAINVLYICNGQDPVVYYDGTTWQTSLFTGPPLLASMDYVHAHMNRLWFVEKNSLNLWYGGVAAIGGALSKFSLSSLFRHGGRIVAVGSWTRDGGAGPDDNLVVVTDKGQVAIYAGTSPVSASTSALLGVYKIAEPVGRRCLLSIGSDLAVITSYGFVPMSKVLPLGETAGSQIALSDKIGGAFMSAYRSNGRSFGWQAIEYPKQHLVVINVPLAEGQQQQQYIINTHTGAWARWLDMNAGCWGLFSEHLYWGSNDGRVFRYDPTFNTDYKYKLNTHLPPTDPENVRNYNPITAYLATAYVIFGTRRVKMFRQARPIFMSPPFERVPRVQIRVNYDLTKPSVATGYAKTSGCQWAIDAAPAGSLWQWAGDGDLWGDDGICVWASGARPALGWQGVEGEGVAAAILFGLQSDGEVIYNGCDVTFEIGGIP